MNILIRTNSSSHIGTGHIMRDLVLAKKYKNSNIIFACEDLKGNINQKILDEGSNLEIVKTNEVKEVLALIKKYKIDLLVIDSYEIDYKYEQNIKENSNVKLLCFDDTYEKHCCDIVLNNSISANKEKYKKLVPKTCEIKTGLKYSLLRDEFTSVKQNRRVLKKKRRVFLAMGGADHSNLNIKILEVLKGCKNIEVILVSTKANKNLQKLQLFALKNKFVKLHINSNNIAKLLNSCDFAISTPSVTISEVMALSIPFIAIKTAPNQSDIAKYLKEKRFLVLEKFDKNILDKNINILQKEYYYTNTHKKIKRLTKC